MRAPWLGQRFTHDLFVPVRVVRSVPWPQSAVCSCSASGRLASYPLNGASDSRTSVSGEPI